ncbi:hypothetical protein DIPPA_27335 [Diplonema papillatum]|nr:hypothetical protein DIPPA_27335 [Diplonema papillatum]
MVEEPGPDDRELTAAEELAKLQAYLAARNATYGDELTLQAAVAGATLRHLGAERDGPGDPARM